ncbi:MAG TPA: nucleotide pyrophosphohydrolase [Ktedonobacteraceae bacterium]|jgi:NTP pyrophosphatase (non-canonical NTP hydrolase)
MHTLRDVQQEIDHLIKEEWHSHYWAPLSSLARLTEEVGELARELNHHYGEKPKKTSEQEGSIAAELGDILYIVASLANSLNIDLDTAFDEVMQKYRSRDTKRWQAQDTATTTSFNE